MINIMLTKCAGFSQDDNQNEQDFSQDAAQRSAVWRKIVFLNREFSLVPGALWRFCIIMRAAAADAGAFAADAGGAMVLF